MVMPGILPVHAERHARIAELFFKSGALETNKRRTLFWYDALLRARRWISGAAHRPLNGQCHATGELSRANRKCGRVIGKDISLIGAQLQLDLTLGHFFLDLRGQQTNSVDCVLDVRIPVVSCALHGYRFGRDLPNMTSPIRCRRLMTVITLGHHKVTKGGTALAQRPRRRGGLRATPWPNHRAFSCLGNRSISFSR